MTSFAPHEPHASEKHASATRTLVVRTATEMDAATIATIIVERDGGPFEEQDARVRRRLAPGGPNKLFLGEVDGVPAGYARVTHFQPEDPQPANGCPEGWYLMGVIVRPDYWRLGLGRQLTERRLRWIAERAPEAFYFANERNLASIDLHAAFGFTEVARGIQHPGVTFTDGEGILFRAALA